MCTLLQEGLLNCSQTQLFTCGLLHGLPWVHGPACEDVSFDIHLHRFSPTAHRLMLSMSAADLFQRFPSPEGRSEIDYSLSELKWVEHVEATADCWLLCCSTLGVCDPELTPTLGGDLSKDPKKDP